MCYCRSSIFTFTKGYKNMIETSRQESFQTKDQYLSESELDYPAEERQILQALRYLADNDDGAADKDHAGFSRTDGEFGRDLARKGRPFTARQLLSAYRVTRKYARTQLSPAGFLLPDETSV